MQRIARAQCLVSSRLGSARGELAHKLQDQTPSWYNVPESKLMGTNEMVKAPLGYRNFRSHLSLHSYRAT